MTLQSRRIEWEQRPDLVETAKEILQQEQLKATIQSSLPDLYEKCDKINASLLFQPSWRNLLKDLCHKISSFSSNSKGGWMDFAGYLGLNNDFINCVLNRNINIPMDNAYIILVEFSKDSSATIDRIFRALEKMERYDIIDTLYSEIIDLCNAANMNQSYSQDGGYRSEENNVRTEMQQVDVQEVICNSFDTDMTTKLQLLKPTIDVCLQKTCVINETSKAKADFEKVLSKTVMLTFAEDGIPTAKKLAFALRKSLDKQGRSMGVVVLSENKAFFADDPCIKIADCFNQVDFVISIITKKYLARVLPSPSTVGNDAPAAFPSPSISPTVEPDVFYSPFVFRLMSTEYTRRHCLNSRFRSVIPNDQKDILFSNNPIMNVPFLSQWCLSEDAIESPRKSLLLRNRKCL